MDDSFGNYAIGDLSRREREGAPGDSGSRGSFNYRFRRGNSQQRGRNLAENRYSSYDHQTSRSNSRFSSGVRGDDDSVPDSPISGVSSTGDASGSPPQDFRARGVPGPQRFNPNNSYRGRGASQNAHDCRVYAGAAEVAHRADRSRWAVAQAPSPSPIGGQGSYTSEDDQSVHAERDPPTAQQRNWQQEYSRRNATHGSYHPRRGGAGRSHRFHDRASDDAEGSPDQPDRASYHEEAGDVSRRPPGLRRNDEVRAHPQDAVDASDHYMFSEGSERAADVQHSPPHSHREGHSHSLHEGHSHSHPHSNWQRDGSQGGPSMSDSSSRRGRGRHAAVSASSREAEEEGGPRSTNSVDSASENGGRSFGYGGGGRRDYHAWKNRGSGPKAVAQSAGEGHRRDHRKDGQGGRDSAQADQAAVLWRAKKSQVPQLVQELEEKLSRGSVECMICYDMVGRASPMWSCGSCYAIFHLSCIKKWARAPTSADLSVSSANHSLEGNWRCPGCQAVEFVGAKDLRYYCFCGQVENPNVDHYLTPHSCGGPCKKALDKSKTKRCNHHCTMQCHPGPCPPCSAVAPSECCPCGKKTFTRRCGEQKAITSCGDICGRKLLCGRHSCSHVCHEGSCETCKVEVKTQCFCGLKQESMLCGSVEIQGNLDFGKGICSCRGRCSKVLSCGNHRCQDKCHPGPCGECEISPVTLQTCPCGKRKIQELVGSGKPRKTCLDPVPTCGQGCGKLLLCKLHVCRDLCHAGPCPPCRVPVDQKCRCGASSRSVACHVSQGDAIAGEESAGLFLCERKCGQKKSCGRHRCNNRCCPGDGSADPEDREQEPHECVLACGKKLRCKQHNCHERCHSGHCPPCLESIFTELSCACGRTSIPPPVPCGTPLPACQEPCSFPQPCGHPATHLCHFGDCPPCTVPVSKECVGNHVVLRGVPCGSRDIKCNKLCGKTRQCGLHACARTCHLPPCDSTDDANAPGAKTTKRSCGQYCGAPRRDCSHTCVSTCHPSAPCPDTRCKVIVTITCGCGRISGDVPCDAGGSSSCSSSRASAETEMLLSRLPAPLQPIAQGAERSPLGQRKLSCDDECGKLEKRRLLADAFGVDLQGEGAGAEGGMLGSELLTEMLRKDPQWVVAVEERFRSLLLGPKTTTGIKVHVFCPMPIEKRDIISQLAEKWSLAVCSAGREPRRFPIVHVTNKSKVPYQRLISKTPAPAPGQQLPPAFNPAVDMEPGFVVAFFDVPREVDMSSLVLRFAGECELVWLNDKNALAIFGDAARAATALRRVDHTTAYKGAISVPGSAVFSSSKGAWGQTSGSSSSKLSAKKKAVQESSWVEDAWGEENRKSSKEQLTGGWQRNQPPITTTKNPWGALEQTRARLSDAQLKGCYVTSQPLGTPQVSTKDGESSAQGEWARVPKSTPQEGGEQVGTSGVSQETPSSAIVCIKAPSSSTHVHNGNEEEDWERLLD